MRALVIAPHSDDEVLGAAGYMAKLARAGHEVHVLIMCDRSESHDYDPRLIKFLHECCKKANRILGVKEVHYAHLQDEKLDRSPTEVIVPIEKHIAWIRPDLVFIPHGGDVNQDHRAVFNAAMVATRTLGNWENKYDKGELPGKADAYSQKDKADKRYNVEKVLIYEVLSTTEQAPPLASWAFIPNVFVDITDTIDLKVKALNCYSSEVADFPFPRSGEAVRHLAAVRGLACAVKAAEAFMLKREIVIGQMPLMKDNGGVR